MAPVTAPRLSRSSRSAIRLPVLRVPSADGIPVAVHELAGDASNPVLLFAHATGFHGRCFLPMADALADRYRSLALDFHGHGDTPRPPDWQVDWDRYGDDALAVVQTVSLDAGGVPIVGFGHSKGGAALLMAAHRDPSRFRLLILFEPVVPPTDVPAPSPRSSLAAGARKRRATFASIEEALENYASKPPMDAFDPAALLAYVTYGFTADPEHPGQVRLKCDPEHEARTFDQGGQHRTWELLPDIDVPVVVLGGRVDEAEETGPSMFVEAIAERLPRGRAVVLPQLDHFGPMTHPRLVAELVASADSELNPGQGS